MSNLGSIYTYNYRWMSSSVAKRRAPRDMSMQRPKTRRPIDETYNLGVVILQAVPLNCAAEIRRSEGC